MSDIVMVAIPVGAGTSTIVETDALSRTFVSNWATPGYGCTGKYYVSSFTRPGGLQTTIGYTGIGSTYGTYQVSSVARGGQTWAYANANNVTTVTDPALVTTQVTASPTAQTEYYSQPSVPCGAGRYEYGRVTKVKDALLRETNYGYSWVRSPTSATQPEGNGQTYTYDARSNLLTVTRKAKPLSGLADSLVFQAGYDTTCSNAKTCNQPNWTKDALGNQTDYTYHSHGGNKTVTLPVDSNGYRLRTFYTYTAYNTGNGLIQRVTRTETCGLLSTELSLTACPTMRGGSDVRHLTQVTVTDYGTSTTAPNTYNTFLPYQVTKTDGGTFLSATVTYGYDAWGRVTSVDGPLSGAVDVTYTTYDAVGRKVFEIGADPDGGGALLRSAVKHTYNVDDQETKTETGTVTGTDGSGFVVSSFVRMTYDSLGRRTKTETVQP